MPAFSDHDAAYAARLWAGGRTQREIGAMLGYANNTAVSIAIRNFVHQYVPDFAHRFDAAGQKCFPLVSLALTNYCHQRGRQPPERFERAVVGAPVAVSLDLGSARAMSTEERLEIKLSDLPFTARVRNCCLSDRLSTVRDLLGTSESELMRIPNFGRISLREVNRMIAALGLSSF